MTNKEDWTARVDAERAIGNLTRSYKDVLLALPTFRGHGGEIFPSHESIARRARVSVRTVERALNHARFLGMVHWFRRDIRRGWRKLRTSNRYFLMVPAGRAVEGRRPVFPSRRTNRQAGRLQAKEVSKKVAWKGMLAEAARGPDLLALRRAHFEAQQRRISPWQTPNMSSLK